jgi:phage terminase small subunit
MGFSSRLKAHKHMLTLETLQFIIEFLEDGNARMAALRAGIPETYASRHGAWLKKHPIVQKALATDEHDRKRLQKSLRAIQAQMEICKEILGIDEV